MCKGHRHVIFFALLEFPLWQTNERFRYSVTSATAGQGQGGRKARVKGGVTSPCWVVIGVFWKTWQRKYHFFQGLKGEIL